MDYALDANVFIEAARRYYAFSICPGFWQSLIHHHAQGHIFSIDRVKEEMADRGDELATWVADQVLDACFESSDTEKITATYAQLIAWVNEQTQFNAAAKAEFAEKADAWLIAYAKATGKVLVTHEVLHPEVKRKVPIPNVCEAFDVEYHDTFEMLKALGAAYHWNASE
jgi:hypothetical protein